MTTILAAGGRGNWTWVFIAGAVLIVIALVFFAVIWRFRERWLKDAGEEESSEPWTLHDLRQMRERGDLSEDEYRAMRRAMIDAYRPREPEEAGAPDTPDNAGRDDNEPDFDLKNTP